MSVAAGNAAYRVSCTRAAIMVIFLVAAVLTSAISNAQQLSPAERQFIQALKKNDIESAKLFIETGMVNPYELSTGQPLLFYLYSDHDRCRTHGESYSTTEACIPARDVVDFLGADKLDWSVRFKNDRTVWHQHCVVPVGVEGYDPLLDILEEYAGLDPAARESRGYTPMHICVEPRPHAGLGPEVYKAHVEGSISMMTLLLQKGADINAAAITPGRIPHPMQGATPLMVYISGFNHFLPEKEMELEFGRIQWLIENGADPAVKDVQDRTVANHISISAVQECDKKGADFFRRLQDWGVDLDHPHPQSGKSILQLAMERGFLNCARELMALRSQ